MPHATSSILYGAFPSSASPRFCLQASIHVQVTFLTKPELTTSSLGHLLSLLVHLQAERALEEGTSGSGSPPSLGSVTRQEKLKA
jgi:hypothetical protein